MSRVVNDTDLFERLIAHAITDVWSISSPSWNHHRPVLTQLEADPHSMAPIQLVIIALLGFSKFGVPPSANARGVGDYVPF